MRMSAFYALRQARHESGPRTGTANPISALRRRYLYRKASSRARRARVARHLCQSLSEKTVLRTRGSAYNSAHDFFARACVAETVTVAAVAMNAIVIGTAAAIVVADNSVCSSARDTPSADCFGRVHRIRKGHSCNPRAYRYLYPGAAPAISRRLESRRPSCLIMWLKAGFG